MRPKPQCDCQRCQDWRDALESEAWHYVQSKIGKVSERQNYRESSKLFQRIAKAISAQPHGETDWSAV